MIKINMDFILCRKDFKSDSSESKDSIEKSVKGLMMREREDHLCRSLLLILVHLLHSISKIK